MDRKIVTEIPANPMLANLQHRKRKLRVAAYCRVSTEEEEQQNSFEVQVDYYTEKISNHEGWQLAGIFADDGSPGCEPKKESNSTRWSSSASRKNRPHLNKIHLPICQKHPWLYQAHPNPQKLGDPCYIWKRKHRYFKHEQRDDSDLLERLCPSREWIHQR